MVGNKLQEHFKNSLTVSKDVTFSNAKFENIHRWFPYLEGFSETFIEDILKHIPLKAPSIYEPFAGSGTLPVHSIVNGYDIYYSEVNPFLEKLIFVKLETLSLSTEERHLYLSYLQDILDHFSENIANSKVSEDLEKSFNQTFIGLTYFPKDNFLDILKTRSYLDTIKDDLINSTIEMACCEALLHSSFLKRMGDIRYRKGKELEQIVGFVDRTKRNLRNIIEDLTDLPTLMDKSLRYFTPNAKFFDINIENKIDVIITSPPYLNGTNYIRNTKLELWFMRFLKTKSDLSHFRRLVVTAGINDVGREIKSINLPQLKHLLDNPDIWYDKRIPKMINDYFYDMQNVISNSYKYLKKGGLMFVDIGDSIYGGVHIPTDLILIDLIKECGFSFKDNIKLRERKSKGGEIVKQTLIVAEKL